MLKRLVAIWFILLNIGIVAAQDSYKIGPININSDNDDFAPFMWNEYLVYTSEQHGKFLLIKYKDQKRNSGVSNMFKAVQVDDSTF